MTDPKQDDADTYGMILDLNAQLIRAARQQVSNMEKIRAAFIIQAERCDKIITELALVSAETADSVANTLLTEFGFDLDDSEDEDEDEDEEAEDD